MARNTKYAATIYDAETGSLVGHRLDTRPVFKTAQEAYDSVELPAEIAKAMGWEVRVWKRTPHQVRGIWVKGQWERA